MSDVETGVSLGPAHWLNTPSPESLRFLYHYANPGKVAAMLDGGVMFLGPYARMNDPRENKQVEPNFLNSSGATPQQLEEAAHEANHFLRRGARLLSFTIDSEPEEGSIPQAVFHRGWARARMCDQYASGHRGACLVFDFGELFERIHDAAPISPNGASVFISSSVQYRDSPLEVAFDWPDIQARGIEAVLKDTQTTKPIATELYTTKNRDWESEREWRAVAVEWGVSRTEDVPTVHVPFGSALRAIVLGERFPDTERSVIRKRAYIGACEIVRCEWKNGMPGLVTS